MAEIAVEKMLKRDLVTEVERLAGDNYLLQEGLEAAAATLLSIQAEDAGWAPMNSFQQHDGFVITQLHELYAKMKVASKGNPLLKRGFTLRSSYVWGRGLELIGEIPPRFQKKIDKNKEVLFTQSAFISNERSLFNAGQFFLFYDKGKDEAYPVSFSEITNFASNPNRISDVWYYQRTWRPIDPATNMPTDDVVIEWYPVAETAERSGKPLLKEIQNQPVNPRVVVIDVRVNRDEDEVWGVPDVLPAYPYAWAHAEYLKDGSRLLKALSTIAWKVVSKSKGNSTAAAIKMGGARGAGQTANMTADTDLVAMPKAGQVDLGDGDRIASYVAAALGVSLTALLSTAGAAGGSFGAEASLDTPAQNDALSRQAIWENYYERVLRVMGIKDDAGIKVVFHAIQEEPSFRRLQAIATAFQTGALNQEEYRTAALEVLDIKATTTELPKPNAFTGAESTNPDLAANNAMKIAQMQQQNALKIAKTNATAPAPQAGNGPASATPAQGKTGKVGALHDGDNTLRDISSKPGTSGGQ